MDEATIRAWVAKAEAEVRELTAEAERAQRRAAQARTQLGLLYELLASVTGEPVGQVPEAAAAVQSVRERVVSSVVDILRDHGGPMRVQDIHSEFLRRELPLPGKGTPANIGAHLVDRKVFTRPRRGYFGLAERDTATPSAAKAEAPPHRGRAKARRR